MLILSRKPNESIVIDGRITVRIVRVDGETVKIGITAPADVPVHRQEVYDEICRSNQETIAKPNDFVPKLSPHRAQPRAGEPLARLPARLHCKPNQT
jgi:carbon storage regulator